MYPSSELPWMKIHEFLLNIENVREPKEFCVQVVKRIYPLIPYDQARVYFVDGNGEVVDEVLIGVEQRWSDIYREYYSKIENGRYSISARIENTRYSIPTRTENGRYTIPKLKGSVYDWTRYEGDDEFITNYIRPQRLRYSAGFGFYDADSFMKSTYTLDRTSRSGYTHEELDIIRIVQPHLDNLHKNLFVLPSRNVYIRNPQVQRSLTKRESEIAELLCKGMTPIKISRKLFLSLPTVYWHIANIHTKLNVSNRQELLLKLMSNSGEDEKS
jgi:DNA-binding CsgD family transcriptional regulator